MWENEGKERDCEGGEDDDAERGEEGDVGSCDAGEGESEEVGEYCGGVVQGHLFEAEGEDEWDC